MSLEEMPRETLIKIIEGKEKTLENTRTRLKEAQREAQRLRRETGLQEDGFRDTPSLNVIRFVNGRPHCSKHGAMNRYDHSIYRCVMCGVAVCLEDLEVKTVEGPPAIWCNTTEAEFDKIQSGERKTIKISNPSDNEIDIFKVLNSREYCLGFFSPGKDKILFMTIKEFEQVDQIILITLGEAKSGCRAVLSRLGEKVTF